MIKWFFLFLFLIFVYHVREVFPPFIVGGIIAYLLNPLVKWVCREVPWMRPWQAVGVIYLGTIGIIALICVHFGPELASQFNKLFDEKMIYSVVNQISTRMNLGLDVSQVSKEVLASMKSAGKPAEIVHVGGVISKSLLAIFVCVVSSVYLITDSARVGSFFLRFVPAQRRVTVVNLSSQMNVMLSKYVSGQLILIVLMSCVSWGILTCFGIKSAMLIGIFCGVMEIIPVLGPWLAIGLATIVSCTQLDFSIISLGVPACLFLARQIEDYVVVPKVIGHAVELHPLAVIFAVLVGETMAGALGMLIAIPVAASIKLILDFCYPPESIEHPKEHGGMLAWIVAKFKGNVEHRGTITPEQEQAASRVAWAQTKNEVETNDRLAEQMSLLNNLEEIELKEAALIKHEQKKLKTVEEKQDKALEQKALIQGKEAAITAEKEAAVVIDKKAAVAIERESAAAPEIESQNKSIETKEP
jgi:predicted PurR-regulated permease PerM